MKINLSQEDLNRGMLVEPGWYPSEIKNYKEEKAKTDGSTNAVMDVVVLSGPFTGASGVVRFNEKAPGFAVNFLKALGGKEVTGADGKATMTAELSPALNGKKLDVYFRRKTWEGKDSNDPADYAPLGKLSAQQAK